MEGCIIITKVSLPLLQKDIFSLAFFCVPTLNPEDFMVLNGGLLLSLGT